MWRSTIHVLVKQALVLTKISTPVKRKIKSLDLLQCQYPQYLSPLPGKGKVWLSKRQVHMCHIYNHSLTMEQCTKLSELNLQLTEFVPEPFAKLCYLKFEFPQLNTSEFFGHISFESNQLICGSHCTLSNYLHEYACSNHHQCSNKCVNTLQN